MTDRELLEMAAKAEGTVYLDASVKHHKDGGPVLVIPRDGLNFQWDPLIDDADAFRLAVKLGEKYPAMVVGIFNRGVFPHTSASVVHREGNETYVEQDAGDDLAAATRRAIVRAAAALESQR